jgi:hypothetical protein
VEQNKQRWLNEFPVAGARHAGEGDAGDLPQRERR